VFEVRQRITEAPLTTCDACGGSVHRLLSPAPFILKGEGWYVTDYPSAARKKAMDSEKSSSSTPSPDKPAAKTDGAKTDGGSSSGTSSGASSSSSSAAKSD
jgi:putative FmdB family regulatory protein